MARSDRHPNARRRHPRPRHPQRLSHRTGRRELAQAAFNTVKSARARWRAHRTLGATRRWTTTGYATAQWKARSARRCPPPPGPTLTNRNFFSFAEAQIHARLTNPAKQNIITSIRGSKGQVADIKSEPRPASNRNQWPASYWNAWPASSVSAPCAELRTARASEGANRRSAATGRPKLIVFFRDADRRLATFASIYLTAISLSES